MLAIYLIGMMIITAICLNEYKLYCDNQRKMKEMRREREYMKLYEENQNLIKRLLEMDEAKFDPDARVR